MLRVYNKIRVNYGYGLNNNQLLIINLKIIIIIIYLSVFLSFLIHFIKLIHTIPVVYAYLEIHSNIKKGLELCNISIHAIPVVSAYLGIHSNSRHNPTNKTLSTLLLGLLQFLEC